LKLVSVKFEACGFPLPTFNLVLYQHRQLATMRDQSDNLKACYLEVLRLLLLFPIAGSHFDVDIMPAIGRS
jgi:hypothetical protein